LAILFGAAPLFAQAGIGPGNRPLIQGEVTLPSGNPAPEVYIQLEPENGGGMIASAITDSAGFYVFPQVGEGDNYTIVINVQGFEPINKLVMVTDMLTVENFTLVPIPARREPNAGASVPVQALKIPPAAWQAYVKAARQIDQGDDAGAAVNLQKAIHLFPKFTAAYRKLSAVDANQGKFADAAVAIQQAMSLEKNGETYAYLGYLYMQEKEPKKAKDAFVHSIRMSPNDWLAQMELGRLLYNDKDYKGAYPHLELARKLRPDLRTAHLLLYDDLIRLNKQQEALDEVTSFLKRFPKAPEAPQMQKMKAALEASLAHPAH
jgi:tetratricopeptide (TPR) repeat protein